MQESPRDLAFNMRPVPVGMDALDVCRKHRARGSPDIKPDPDPFSRTLFPEDVCHGIIEYFYLP
jgi:hypothetical protein